MPWVRVAVLWIAVPVLLNPVWVSAEAPIQVRASTHSLTFGQEIKFHLEVASEDPILSIALAYRTSDAQGATVETMSFIPSMLVNVNYAHQIEHRYIRPFAEVTYWWTIVNAAQARMTTDPQTFAYTDDRFDWQSLSGGVVNIHWYDGDLKIAQQALDVAIAGLDRARQDIGVDAFREPIDIYMYARREDLSPALPDGLPSGAEALTLYETSVVLVPFGPEESYIPQLKRILPHEVTHALIHEVTQNDFDHVPRWLAEGLATSVQHTFAPDPGARALIEEAVREQSLFPLDTLCAAFPQDLVHAQIAYAESASVVDYIRDMHGRQKLSELVSAYADGATCQGGVHRVLGIDLERLESQWLDSLAPRAPWDAFWADAGPWVVLFVLSAAFPFLFIVRRPIQSTS